MSNLLEWKLLLSPCRGDWIKDCCAVEASARVSSSPPTPILLTPLPQVLGHSIWLGNEHIWPLSLLRLEFSVLLDGCGKQLFLFPVGTNKIACTPASYQQPSYVHEASWPQVNIIEDKVGTRKSTVCSVVSLSHWISSCLMHPYSKFFSCKNK